jgi:methylmalonyl-CoA/ethylmalonyl-CoA epimerase
MIKNVNHIAIVVPDLKAAVALYRDVLGAEVSDPVDLPDHGVTTVFVHLGNTKIELLYPLGENSPVQGFLDKNPAGGMHHLCFDVDDVMDAQKQVASAGIRVIGANKSGIVESPKIGAHGKPVVFLHPKDTMGCLIELE